MPLETDRKKLTREELRGVFTLYSARRLQEALAVASGLLQRYPDEPVLHNILGAIYAGLEQFDSAIASYERALLIDPHVAEPHFHLGNALLELGRLDAAVSSFEQAVRLKPDFVDAHSKVCQGLERASRLDEMDEALQRARLQCPGVHPSLTLREAELLKRQGEYAAARTLLETASQATADADTSEARAYLLGDLCDRLGDVAAAFAYVREANLLCKNSFPTRQVDGAAYSRVIDTLTQRFSADWAGQWQQPVIDDGQADPVFLVGFPRSGTTLLDTVLRGHHGIAVLEEKPTVLRLETAIQNLSGGYPQGLAALDSAQISGLRQVYFSELQKHLDPGDQSALVVDKLPLNLVHAGLIQRIFPQARFLFSQRHPCDCVLSCFMRSFKINEGMVNFLDLEDAANLYDRVMRLWQQYRQVLPLRVHTVRYEDLVDDFEGTLGPALDFLGVGWDEGMLNYVETAKSREQINTPSYNQVTQALYTQASGRWQRYREFLEPVLPALQPWIEGMGYTG